MDEHQDAVRNLVDQIVQAVRPIRVILFGSAARGESTINSDIDVLVVVDDDRHRRRTAQHLYRSVRGIGVPFDIIVAHPGDLERHKDNIGLIYRSVMREGREVYAA
jgi:predicted nucleotidyltransferase